MGKHSPGPGRRPIDPYRVMRYVDSHGSHYSQGWWSIPFRVSGLAFLALLAVLSVEFGAVKVVDPDPPAQVAFVSSEAPALATHTSGVCVR